MTDNHPFERFKFKMRGVLDFYIRFMVAVVAFSVVFGAWPPVTGVALLFTVLLPILLLVLFGDALDEELGWMDRLEER
ncbi:MAG: hypothetical protein AAF638_02805 [Pseudomonadota bacterium]